MVDIESIYADLNEYLGGERIGINPPRYPIENPMANADPEDEEEESQDYDPPDDNGDDIVERALSGQTIDRTMGEMVVDEQHGGSDDEMGAESPRARRTRYMNSSQNEV
eukprot:s3317_g2.t1